MVYSFCGVGKDAVILNQILDYKPACMKSEMCKIGIPVSSFKNVIPKLIETGYSYIIYNHTKEKSEMEEIYRIEGQEVYEEKENLGCKGCWNCENKVKDTSEYIKEIQELMENTNE